jgi:hypothetical protein
MKEKNIVVVLASLPVLLCLAACSRHLAQPDRSRVNPIDTVVLELHATGKPARLESGDPVLIGKVKEWLSGVVARQPRQTELGAVRPWCTVSFFRQAQPQPKLVSSQNVYLYADSSEEPRLLTDAQIQDLYKIMGL